MSQSESEMSSSIEKNPGDYRGKEGRPITVSMLYTSSCRLFVKHMGHEGVRNALSTHGVVRTHKSIHHWFARGHLL